MNCSPLSAFKHRIEFGEPLPFDIHHPDSSRLLARGEAIHSVEHLETLLEQGAVVNLDSTRRRATAAAPATLPASWNACTRSITTVLLTPPLDGSFEIALDAAAQPLLTLLERDPDLAIFQLLRESSRGGANYGVTHSVHSAIASHLVAQRLGWNASDTRRAFNAALTMNLSMLELQGQLAARHMPLTSTQRDAIAAHPLASVRLLEDCGVGDRQWLDAVAQHHELPDGSGYPRQLREVCELASLLRHADIYTARLSPRATRDGQAADLALKEMFRRGARDPIVTAIAREFGMYPPGCYVMLACGETAVVIKRGQSLGTPLVVSMLDSSGTPLDEPVRRDTALAEYAIVKAVSDRRVRLSTRRRRLAARTA